MTRDRVGAAHVKLPWRYHFFGSFAIVLAVAGVISTHIADRSTFANSEIHGERDGPLGCADLHRLLPRVSSTAARC